LTHVPYQGSAAAVTDLLAGRIAMMFAPLSTVLPYIRSGRLTALATTGAARSGQAPDLPTLAELGLKDFESTVWFGIAAPPGLPRAVEGAL
ncbi:tripartite tricarboxylate transporter substrate-binding protein, partial [Acinetobacter baumannii]